MKKLLMISLAFVCGCGQVRNPCEDFSNLETVQVTYCPSKDGRYMPVAKAEQKIILDILNSSPKTVRGRSTDFPAGYIKIQEVVFKLNASINYTDGRNRLYWSDKRITQLGISLFKRYMKTPENVP